MESLLKHRKKEEKVHWLHRVEFSNLIFVIGCLSSFGLGILYYKIF